MLIYMFLANTEQEQEHYLHHSTDSNSSTCTQVHSIKMIYNNKISWYS